MKVKKIWGWTEEIFPNVWSMFIDKGGYSSNHKHDDVVNEFYVLSGKLRIYSKPVDTKDEVYVDLGQGERISVQKGVWHRFECLEECICIEMYFQYEYSYNIERKDVGGKK